MDITPQPGEVRKEPAASPEPVDVSTEAVESDGMFHIDGKLRGIELGNKEDLVELHESINMLQIAPTGFSPQKCSAYVCAIRRQNVTRVYIALYLTESKAVQVYVTAGGKMTPASEDALREAVMFAETVGFMMDRVDIGTSQAERDQVLKGIPVFLR
jgi:hypothetical protein